MTVIVKLVQSRRQRKKRQKTTPSSWGKISILRDEKSSFYGILPFALESKIRFHFQNKIPFEWTKTLKMVDCTLNIAAKINFGI
jgi:hypothetical protein